MSLHPSSFLPLPSSLFLSLPSFSSSPLLSFFRQQENLNRTIILYYCSSLRSFPFSLPPPPLLSPLPSSPSLFPSLLPSSPSLLLSPLPSPHLSSLPSSLPLLPSLLPSPRSPPSLQWCGYSVSTSQSSPISFTFLHIQESLPSSSSCLSSLPSLFLSSTIALVSGSRRNW